MSKAINWYWEVDQQTKRVTLYGNGPRGKEIVMSFIRYGMNGAQPCFNVDGVMVPASELAVAIPGQEHNQAFLKTIDNATAEMIAHCSQGANVLEAFSKVAACQRNEATAFPWWMIVDPQPALTLAENSEDLKPQRLGDSIAMNIRGPFFSRDRAKGYLNAHHYNFSKHAFVWCSSGHESQEYRDLYEASKKLQPVAEANNG